MTLTAIGEQVPHPGEIYLDHVGWMVPDMNVASARFERLGFPLTPFSVHGDRDPESGALRPMGSANRLIMLANGYLEILTPHGDLETPVRRHMQSCIEKHVGVHLLAFSVADPKAEAGRIGAAGFSLQPVVNLRRTIEAQGGGVTEVAFTVLRAAFDAAPEARIQVLAHHTPEHMWQPRYVVNRLGITGLLGATIVGDDPSASAERMARFVGRLAEPEVGGMIISLDRGWLKFRSHRQAQLEAGGDPLSSPPFVASVTLTTNDLPRAGAELRRANIAPLRQSDNEIVIGSEDAMGVKLRIVKT